MHDKHAVGALALSFGVAIAGCPSPPQNDAAADTTDIALVDSSNGNDTVSSSDAMDAATPTDAFDAPASMDATTVDVSYDTWEGALVAHEHRGLIGLSLVSDGDGGLQSAVNVMMISQTPPPAIGVQTCASQMTDGECVASIACNTASPVDASAPGPTRIVGAGIVTLVGGSASPWTLTPMTDSFGHVIYGGGLRPGVVWQTGDHITIDAPGDEAPAFHFERDFPPRLSITSPVLPAAGRFTLVRASDLAFTWSETGPGLMEVSIEQATSAGRSTIACRFPASRGNGVVPHTLLSLLDPTDATTNDSLVVQSTNSFQPLVGDWYMAVNVTTGDILTQLTIQ